MKTILGTHVQIIQKLHKLTEGWTIKSVEPMLQDDVYLIITLTKDEHTKSLAICAEDFSVRFREID